MITNEEAKKIIFNQWQSFLEDNIDYGGISEAYKMAIKALELQRWIPCSERLPEERMYCLITVEITPHGCSPSYEVQTSWFDGRNFIYKTYIDDCIVAKRGVIAWMPLPEPYSESEEGDEK